MNLFDELVAVVRTLDAAGIDYALVGGLAVGVWGAPRATTDIDMVTVDFILVDANLEPVWRSRERRDTEVVPISVVSREALIAMKLAAGRPQDQADVIRLTEQDR